MMVFSEARRLELFVVSIFDGGGGCPECLLPCNYFLGKSPPELGSVKEPSKFALCRPFAIAFDLVLLHVITVAAGLLFHYFSNNLRRCSTSDMSCFLLLILLISIKSPNEITGTLVLPISNISALSFITS